MFISLYTSTCVYMCIRIPITGIASVEWYAAGYKCSIFTMQNVGRYLIKSLLWFIFAIVCYFNIKLIFSWLNSVSVVCSTKCCFHSRPA